MQALSLLHSCSRAYKRRLLYSRSDYIKDGEDKEFLKLMNMYTPTKIEAIKIFWKKDLSFGCIVLHQHSYTPEYWPEQVSIVTRNDGNKNESEWLLPRWVWVDSSYQVEEYTILWHEPHLEDVFRVAEEKWFTFDLINFWKKQPRLTSLIPSNENFNIPINPNIPLLEQPEETLKQLISLFK